MDSFTNQDTFSYEDALALCRILNKAGACAQTVNFSGGGYGVDYCRKSSHATGTFYGPECLCRLADIWTGEED